MTVGFWMTVLWVFMYGYLILASIDFGASIFAYTGMKQDPHGVNQMTRRYLSPVWEFIHLLFVLFFIWIIGQFPDVDFYYGKALFVPGYIAILLLVVRNISYAFYYYSKKESKGFSAFYGVTGLCIPAALSVGLTVSEGGFIDVIQNKVNLLFGALFSSFYAWSVVILAMVSVLYISAMFLTYYAARAGDETALKKLRGYALFWSVPTILASALVFTALQGHNPEHFGNMLNVAWMFLVSLLSLLVAVTLLFRQQLYGLAFFFVLLQFLFAFFGYGISHLPYILYPYIRIEPGFTLDSMANDLKAVSVMGAALLIPLIVLGVRLYIFKGKRD